ncbi:hypothetical protein Rs2_37475 [Raphanus sativus]|uniref:Uncharacterized protein LOC108821050 n=1 Tax=Raphanus sativus TaxID=3726 RepID=A0A6J0KNR1_RAPSA|nr:uncharacterized protein LOC108821050 [Raphanus sativus]XP_056856540.1 uncharacterized protein LOC130505954 [Raphanus sativus]KAJ4867476.1 hypothetical protein Rs2_50981 [Raphanus sativus]KAJ4880420.1 hypothetical protein Rs2_37475 [Raphanus sativus]
MKGISRRNDGFHRYLKPGALAQIRNTRLNHRSTFPLTLSLPSRVADAATPTTMDQMPDLLRKTYGPSRIGRKKLSPARSVLRTMVDLNPSQNSTLESASSGGNNNLLSIIDALVAH